MNPSDVKQQQFYFIIGATIALFILNNIILGSVIPRMPGGSATGITTMFTVTLVSLTIKKFWCVPMVYFIYGSIGALSHILVDDWLYLLIIILITIISTIYNWAIHRYHYKIAAFTFLFPAFVILMQYANLGFLYLFKRQNPVMSLHATALSIMLGYAGIILAYISYRKLSNHKWIARFNSDSL